MNKQDLESGLASPPKMTTKNNNIEVIYKLRDRNHKLVQEWEKFFADEIEAGSVEVSCGDIFKEAPAADAIVSPANSFGFMDGGIDMAYSMHFGWQLQTRLQDVIRQEYNGELLVGQAVILPTFEEGTEKDNMKWKGYNGDKPIKYLISAPTMRVPLFVDDTVNSYLAFRAVVLQVERFNKEHAGEPIKTVLCPGLGTAVGKMPFDRCAYQMQQAYRTFVTGQFSKRIYLGNLETAIFDMEGMKKFKTNDDSDDEDSEYNNERSLKTIYL